VLYLLADTCVRHDQAKSIKGEQLFAACRERVQQSQLELLVPQLVIDEFEHRGERRRNHG
jgi:predicted nucleic acid-binding protein